MNTGMTIGRVAHLAGVGVETIRYYQRRGLIEVPPKPIDGSYRVYSEATVERIRFIRRSQKLNFSLREIEGLLSLRTQNEADAGDVRRLATEKIAEVEQKIDQLQKIRNELRALLRRCPGSGSTQCCTILETLEENIGSND